MAVWPTASCIAQEQCWKFSILWFPSLVLSASTNGHHGWIRTENPDQNIYTCLCWLFEGEGMWGKHWYSCWCHNDIIVRGTGFYGTTMTSWHHKLSDQAVHVISFPANHSVRLYTPSYYTNQSQCHSSSITIGFLIKFRSKWCINIACFIKRKGRSQAVIIGGCALDMTGMMS